MELVEKLKRLDRRVLGPVRRWENATQYRRGFVVGLVGTVAVVLLAVVLRRSLVLSGVGGFVGVMFGSGVRWYLAAETPADWRFFRPLLALGVAALAGLGVAVATSSQWSVRTTYSDVQPGPYFQKSEPTMVVLCPETDDGAAYTYQAPATETPRCRNGAVPKVVVHG